MTGTSLPRSVSVSLTLLVVAVAALGLPEPADAELIVAVPTSIDPFAGFFDLTIQNDGNPANSVQPSFDTDFGLTLASSLSSTSITIADSADNDAGFATVGPNQIFGLARIFFSLDRNAGPSTSTIAIIPSGSSLSGPAINNAPAIAFTSQNGTIVNPCVVPEPSTFLLVLIAGGCIAAHQARRSRDGAAS